MNTVVGGYFEHAMWGKITLQGGYGEKAHWGKHSLFNGVAPNCPTGFNPYFYFEI
jgi:hypothetical protein